MDLTQLAEQTRALALDILHQSAIGEGQIFVLGLSTSEVIGGRIGKNSNQEVGEVIVKTLLDILNERKIYLAVQGCEHINRALAVERELAEQYGLEIVNVLPGLHAGGSAQLAAFTPGSTSATLPSVCTSNTCKSPCARNSANWVPPTSAPWPADRA